jgi:hypothetical protein
MNKSYSINEVMCLDHLLQQLATYEVCGGKILIPKSPEEAFELHKKMAEKFNYFKRLIRSGECTVEFIKQSVLRKNGPFPQVQFNPNCLLDKYVPDVPQAEPEENKSPVLEKNLIVKLLQCFDPHLTENEVDTILNYPVKSHPAKNTRKSRKKNHPNS